MNYNNWTREELEKELNFRYEELYKQDLEIKRLKESEEYHRKGFTELHNRIDEAIEYIEKQRDRKTKRLDTRLERVSKILTGVDKE